MASPFQPVSAHRYSQMASTLYEALHSQNKVKTHSRSLFTGRFERCFRGSEGVAALLSLRFCRSADEAVRFGNDLVEYGYIVSVKGVGHRFKNKPASLYRFWRDGGAGKEGEVAVPGPSPTGAQVTRLHAGSVGMASTTGGSVHSYNEHEEDPAGGDRHIRDFTPDKTQGTPPSKRTLAIESPASISMAGIAQTHSRRSMPGSPCSAAPQAPAPAPAPAAAAGATPAAAPSPLGMPPSYPPARPPTSSGSRSESMGSLPGGGRQFHPRQAPPPAGPALPSSRHAAAGTPASGMDVITPPPSLQIPQATHASQAALPSRPLQQPAGDSVADFDLASLSHQLIDVHEQLVRLNTRQSAAGHSLGEAFLAFLRDELLTGAVQAEQHSQIGTATVFFVVLRLLMLFVLFLASGCSAVALVVLGATGHMDASRGLILLASVLLPPCWLAAAFSSSNTLTTFRLRGAASPGQVHFKSPPDAAAPPSAAEAPLPVLDMQQVVRQAKQASTVRRRHT